MGDADSEYPYVSGTDNGCIHRFVRCCYVVTEVGKVSK